MKFEKIKYLVCILFILFSITSCAKKCKHVTSDWIVDVESTCATKGSKHKECTKCKEVLETSEIELKEHIYKDGICEVCGKELTSSDFIYKLNPSATGYIITDIDYSKYNPDTISIMIPSQYNGLPVVGIADNVFKDMQRIKRVEIPDSVTSIGSNAFRGCIGLTSITLPFVGNGTNETYFGYIFGAYSCSDNSRYVPATLKEVIITSARSIGDSAFEGCSGLTSILIPDSVTSIGESAFSGCVNLNYNNYDNGLYLGNKNNPYVVLIKAINTNITEIEINEKTHIIYFGALFGCSELISLMVPNGVTNIGYKAFSGCSNLANLTIPFVGNGVNKNYLGYIFGASSYSENSKYIPTTLKEVIITGDTNIETAAFYGCGNLTSIAILNSINSIGNLAFYGCCSLTDIEIPSDITNIGDSAFYNCSNLTSIEIPNGVTNIGCWAFYGCSSLINIEIPNSVTSIGEFAFCNCDKLTIYCETTSKPNGWSTSWNPNNCQVLWGYEK